MKVGDDQGHGLLVSGRFAELEDALHERVLELRQDRPLAPLTIVVGSAAVRTRLGDLLVRRLEALANVSILTLAALAMELVTAAREAPPRRLAGLARERFVRRLVATRAARGLAYFGPVSERPHFAMALAATFSDLREARVSPTVAWVASTTAGHAKDADLQALYAEYCEELGARGLMDDAQVLLDAARAVRNGDGRGRTVGTVDPRAAKIILYGIYDLNQAQEALVVELLATGADLFVPVPRGGDGGGATALEAALAAGLEDHRRESPLAGHAPACGDDLARLAAVWAPRGRTATSAMERVPFRGDGSLGIVSVSDERAEIREAARIVLTAAGSGAALWDCAVVVPRGDDVERMAAGLQACGLPVACRLPDRSEGQRVLLRLAECLAPPAGEPFARRAVLDLLSAAPVRVAQASPREVALWMDEARRAGVVSGLDQWVERMSRRRGDLERRTNTLVEQGQAEISEDDEGEEKLELMRLRLAAARGLEATVGVLARACRGLPSRASWGSWAHQLGGIAEALFETSVAAAVGDVAGRLQALDVVEEDVDAAEMAAVLRERLADATVPVGRVGREGVAVVTPLEIRGLRFHSVVLAGLAEGGFPVRGRPDPILGDADRGRLSVAFGTRLPTAEGRDAESTLLFAFACEAARERLTLLAPRTDAASGRPRLPSRLLLRLASLAAGHPVGLDEFLEGRPLAPVWRQVGGLPSHGDDPSAAWIDAGERDTAALLALSAQGGPAARDYLSAVLSDPVADTSADLSYAATPPEKQARAAATDCGDAVDRRLGAWRAARSPEPSSWDGLLGREARAALAARHPFATEMHPTRLERYVDCPFAFLLRDVLGLDAPDVPGDSLEMDAREFGTLVHEILQRAYQAVIDGDLDLRAALDVVVAVWEDCCAEAERRGVTGAGLSWDVRRVVLLEDVLETLRRDPVFGVGDGNGRPVAVEWRFGESSDRPVVLPLGGDRRVRFAGRLDRLDVTPAGARIVDYKTGAGSAEKERLKRGLSVQLPVYRLAVRQAGDAGYGEIACVYRLVTRRGGFEEIALDGGEAAAEDRLRVLVAETAGLIDAGVFPRSARGRCDFCDVMYACGTSAWTRARKREHESLRGLVRMQRFGPEERTGPEERSGLEEPGDDAGS